MLNRPMFHMGTSFEDKSDDESLFDTNGNIDVNGKNGKDENIPLVTRK